MTGAAPLMHGSDVLETMAQIAVAFAGFSGIVAAFSQQPGQWATADQLRVRNLIIVSLSTMFFALLPSGLEAAHVAERSIWRWSSATMGFFTAISTTASLSALAKLQPNQRFIFSRVILTITIVGSFLNVAAQSMNAAAWPYQPHGAVYIFGVMYMLLMAGALFLRLVTVRPPRD
jgi:hypothetical protein